jgi:ABC-type transport system involved in cytochrome bd biosynthesis fused ATPase/permease subunit
MLRPLLRRAVRAVLVSINLFNLLCDGLGNYSSSPYSSILKFGGPILYLVLQALLAFSILIYVDSGSPIPSLFRPRRRHKSAYLVEGDAKGDVLAEKTRLEKDEADVLRVVRLKKRFVGVEKWAVDDVSFGVRTGENFALIGPNGAGKTTTLACIRGVVCDIRS